MQIAKGRTIVGLDTGDADFASIGKMTFSVSDLEELKMYTEEE